MEQHECYINGLLNNTAGLRRVDNYFVASSCSLFFQYSLQKQDLHIALLKRKMS
jgi:hypothetical protein